MPEQARTRDCIILHKGDAYPVMVDPVMAVAGWRGGQGVQWVASSKDELLVTFSDGLYSGFLLWGSDESSDIYTASTRNQPAYQFTTIGAGGWIIMTNTFEKYTYTSRTGGGPLVPIVYNASDRLVFSLRGYLTKEDEWFLSGDLRAPNDYFIAFVIQAPSIVTSGYMTIQVSI
jgi:hypothetical protein